MISFKKLIVRLRDIYYKSLFNSELVSNIKYSFSLKAFLVEKDTSCYKPVLGNSQRNATFFNNLLMLLLTIVNESFQHDGFGRNPIKKLSQTTLVRNTNRKGYVQILTAVVQIVP